MNNYERKQHIIQSRISYLGNQSEYESGSGQELMETLEVEDLMLNITIFLPPVVFENLTTSAVGLLFTYYRSASLFPLRKQSKTDQTFVASPVIGASLAESGEIYSLPEPIILVLPVMVVSGINIPVFLDTVICHSQMLCICPLFHLIWCIAFSVQTTCMYLCSVAHRICLKITLRHVPHGISQLQVTVTVFFQHYLKHIMQWELPTVILI